MSNKETQATQFFEDSERYLTDAMTFSERAAFDEKLTTNPAFLSKFKEHKALILGIESAVLKEQLQHYHASFKTGRDKKTFTAKKAPSYLWFGMAASLVVLLGIFFFFNNSNHADALFAKHFVPDPGLPTTMGASENYTFFDGMVNYKREEYKTAITKWESLYETKANNDTLNYFLGVAQLANENALEAIPYLEKVVPEKESMFQVDIHHYLGLAYLKTGSIEKAKHNLQKSKKAESAEILDELK